MIGEEKTGQPVGAVRSGPGLFLARGGSLSVLLLPFGGFIMGFHKRKP